MACDSLQKASLPLGLLLCFALCPGCGPLVFGDYRFEYDAQTSTGVVAIAFDLKIDGPGSDSTFIHIGDCTLGGSTNQEWTAVKSVGRSCSLGTGGRFPPIEPGGLAASDTTVLLDVGVFALDANGDLCTALIGKSGSAPALTNGFGFARIGSRRR